MDTKTLVVGQRIHLVGFGQECMGTVIAVTPHGVEVEVLPEDVGMTAFKRGHNTWYGVLRFDKDGQERDGNYWYIE